MKDKLDRVKISENDVAELNRLASALVRTQARKAHPIILALLIENASLSAECNQHREARNLEPLPTYKPELKV